MRQIGPYEVREELARGGMGVVYRAHDPRVGRDVALKLLLSFEAEGEELARFQREAEALARFKRPGVVAVHELGWHQGKPYLVMDLVEGESLHARLKREGPLGADVVRALFVELARALEVVHREGVLHRDLKPQNVIVTPEGRAVLIDFGLAKLSADGRKSLTQSGAILGTPAYMAPEQARSERNALGPSTDVYGLGATLYAALTGRPPFQGGGALAVLAKVCEEDPVPPSRLRPGADSDLERACLRCLAKDPAARFSDCGALADALETRREHPSLGMARRWGLGLLLVCVLAAGVTLLGPRPPAPGTVSEWAERGAEALAIADYGRAERLFRQVVELEPDNPTARMGRARLRAICQDFEGALLELEGVPGPEALRLRVETQAEAGQVDAAIAQCDELLPAYPGALTDSTLAVVHVRRIEWYFLEGGKADEGYGEALRASQKTAEDALERASRSDPGAVEWVIARCMLLHRVLPRLEEDRESQGRRRQECEVLARKHASAGRLQRSLWLELLHSQTAQGKLEAAIETAQERLSACPQDAEFLVLLASLRHIRFLRSPAGQDPDEARSLTLESFTKALEQWPENVCAWGNRATIHLEIVKAEEAAGRPGSDRALAAWEQARADLEEAQRHSQPSEWLKEKLAQLAEADPR